MSFFRTGQVLAATLFLSTAGTAQATSIDAGTILSTFGTISLGDYTLSSHTAAPVYVGGNFSGSHAVQAPGNGEGTVAPGISGTVVVAGDISGTPTLNNSTVLAGTISGNINGGNNTVTTGASVPAAAVRTAMEDLSRDLAAMTDTGASYDFSDQNQLSLTSGAGLNGFAVLNLGSGVFLQNGTLKSFSNTAGTFIVNIGGSNITIGANFNQDDSNVIFNFYEATQITVNSTFGFGILAPWAELNLNGGGTDTFVVGSTINQRTEVRGTFTGDLPETPAVPLPAAGLLLIGGLGAMAAVSRRKKAA